MRPRSLRVISAFSASCAQACELRVLWWWAKQQPESDAGKPNFHRLSELLKKVEIFVADQKICCQDKLDDVPLLQYIGCLEASMLRYTP